MTYKLTWGNAYLMTIFPPLQLLVRIFSMNGSLDKPWLLLFMFPILSAVPAGMMATGNVADGEGGVPYDNNMMIAPIIYSIGMLFSIFGQFGGKKLSGFSKFTVLLLQSIFPLIGSYITFFLRDKAGCEKAPPFHEPIFSAISTHGLAQLSTQMIGFVPFVGPALNKVIKEGGIGGQFINFYIYTTVYLMVYTIMNMINGKNYKDYCSGAQNAEQVSWNILKYVLVGCGTLGTILSMINTLK